jgi:hypothetical protein
MKASDSEKYPSLELIDTKEKKRKSKFTFSFFIISNEKGADVVQTDSIM